MIIFLLIGAVIEILVERWTFVEGMYAWFVTFSTIGFGDYIPLQDFDQDLVELKDIASSASYFLLFLMICFVLLGFCVVSAVLTSLVALAEEMKKKTFTDVWKRKVIKVPRTAANNVEHGKVCEKQGDELVLSVKYRQRSASF